VEKFHKIAIKVRGVFAGSGLAETIVRLLDLRLVDGNPCFLLGSDSESSSEKQTCQCIAEVRA
jgi:hypothetical protein